MLGSFVPVKFKENVQPRKFTQARNARSGQVLINTHKAYIVKDTLSISKSRRSENAVHTVCAKTGIITFFHCIPKSNLLHPRSVSRTTDITALWNLDLYVYCMFLPSAFSAILFFWRQQNCLAATYCWQTFQVVGFHFTGLFSISLVCFPFHSSLKEEWMKL